MNDTNPRTDDKPSAGSTASKTSTSTPDSESASGDASHTTDAGAEGEAAPEEAFQETLEQRYEELEQRYEHMRDSLEEYNRTAIEFIRDNPGICIVGALGAGYVVGRLASRRWLK